MEYQSNSQSDDCINEILDICGATTATYSVATITRRFNRSLDAYFDMAQDASGEWPFDDQAQTSSAILTQNLVSGTNAYKLRSMSGSVVAIRGITILDDNAAVKTLEKELFREAEFETNYVTSDAGTPAYYTLYGDFIYLRPTPNYSETNGLRVYADRRPLYMTPTDTTKEPGVPAHHHLYLCRKTALPYLIEKKLPQKNDIASLVMQDEREIKRYYARRDKTSGNSRFISLASKDSNR